MLAEASWALRFEYAAAVVKLEPARLPESAHDRVSGRYRGEQLLDFVNGLLPPNAGAGSRILGITAADISYAEEGHAEKSVFGLGWLGGPASVVSTFRLRHDAHGAEQMAFRVRRAAVHQVGHTLGLAHCSEAACVMLDPRGKVPDPDTATGHLGRHCRDQLATLPD
jgi:archaemetzincin